VVVNGHGGNYVLQNVVQEANAGGPRVVLFPTGPDWKVAREAAGLETAGDEDMHAGELETSLLLHARPDLVGEHYAQRDWLAPAWRRHLLVAGMGAYTPSGVIGRPSLATAAKGKALLDSLTASFAAHLRLLVEGGGAVGAPAPEPIPANRDGA
jgi:creatinine amidohydrolase